MEEIPSIVIVDGYIDDPAALGVPPYISPIVRAAAGAAVDARHDVKYITMDMLRQGERIPDADLVAVISGYTVPGKYLRSMPMSSKELMHFARSIGSYSILGGSSCSTPASRLFDEKSEKDIAAKIFDILSGEEGKERYRTLEEWNRWMILGASVVKQHQDYPRPLIAEIETYRGCHRYASGGCSYCIEPLKGRPLMRSPKDVLEEAAELRRNGIVNIRIGGQTCIISYGSEDDSGIPQPNPDTVGELFCGLRDLGFEVLHVDNANPAVISEYPEESEKILRILTECCTPGNVLALGMESADINVIEANNLNSAPERTMDAVRMINRIGSSRGHNGMPLLLPGINLIAGLDGETAETYDKNLEFLREVKDEGLILRRINIRQVLPVRREFDVRINERRFRKHKETIREEIDREMLKRVVPYGTILHRVLMELSDGGTTFGRQIGSYPLLVGVSYPLEIGKYYDIAITDWGYRSVTGIEHPFNVNTASMTALSALPGIGKKRAAAIIRNRPFKDLSELCSALDDPSISKSLEDFLTF
ncbi:MAG: radical SAM protein [Thermoplasmatales archaeon]|nr:radical SAM protein [Thermoplasmatales archaeon]